MSNENEKPRPACFSMEHGLKSACKFCQWQEECKKVFWDRIVEDGKAHPTPERNLDD